MFLVDTNVLVHAADRSSPFHDPCQAALAHWEGHASHWFVTWSIVYEYVRVVTHPRVIRPPQRALAAWETVDRVLASPGLMVLKETHRHSAVAAEVLREVPDVAGNFVHDAHIAILMREHGVRRIYTRDVAFRRFPFLEVIDPVAEASAGGVHERPARYRPTAKRRARR
jgi:hypothetical protein